MADTGLTHASAYDAGGQWSNAGNAYADDGTYASETTVGQYQDWYNWRDSGGSNSLYSLIPTGATINGIEVSVKGRRDGGSGTDYARLAAYLYNASSAGYTTGGASYRKDFISNTPATVTFGGPSDLWGKTWTKNDFSDANMYADFVHYAVSGTTTGVSVDFITLKVYYTSTSGSPYTLTATVGALAFSGINSILFRGRRAIAAVGAFVFSGINLTGWRRTLRAVAAVRALTYTGVNLTALKRGLRTITSVGSFVFTGISAVLTRAVTLGTFVGPITVSRIDLAAIKRGLRAVTSVRAFTITGVGVILKRAVRAVTSAVSFALNGISVTLIYGSGRRLMATVGTLSVTGVDVTLKRTLRAIASVKVITFTGVAGILKKGFKAVASVRTISFSGISAILKRASRSIASVLSIPFTGFPVLLNRGSQTPTTVFSFTLFDSTTGERATGKSPTFVDFKDVTNPGSPSSLSPPKIYEIGAGEYAFSYDMGWRVVSFVVDGGSSTFPRYQSGAFDMRMESMILNKYVVNQTTSKLEVYNQDGGVKIWDISLTDSLGNPINLGGTKRPCNRGVPS